MSLCERGSLADRRGAGELEPTLADKLSKTMNALTRWDPFRELEEMQGRLSSILGRPNRRGDGNENEAITVPDWSPLADIIEADSEYVIRAEIPDVEKDGVTVRMENRVLVISGERTLLKDEKHRRYHRMERAYGSFARSFVLPEDADPEKVQASFRNGILEVHVAKSEAAKPKMIDVKVD